MASRNEGDGLAQLTELMRSTPAGAPPRAPRLVDPRTRRRRRRVGLIVTGVIVIVIGALVGSYVSFALNAPVGPASAALAQPTIATPAAAAAILSEEGESAVSITGGDDYLGPQASGVWQASGDDPAPMASISKLVTAMVILQAKPLSSASDPGPTITFSRADHALYDKYYVLNATIAPMPTGSSLSEHDALTTMLVVSACNYAEALADWAYGSEGAFLSATRKWLAANGLTHTSMSEPTGLDARNTSTPADLIALGKLAMANPAVAAMVGRRSLDIPNSPLQGMSNTNDLLGGPYGFDGIKTGTLDTGSDLLFSADLTTPSVPTPMRVYGVVLGGTSHGSVDSDVDLMLHNLVAGFHTVDLGRQGDVVGTYTTRWGAKAKVVLDGSPSVTVWSNTAITAKITPAATLTTGSSREKVGSITWTAGRKTVTVPVVLESAIRPPTAWWRLTHPFELGRS